MAYNNDDYGYGYGSGRDYYRSRRRRRNPFSDGNLAALGKLYADVPVDSVTKAITGLKENYYRNRDLKDKYDQALAQAMVMEGDQQTKQDLINKIRERVDAFAEKGDAYETGDDYIRSIAKDVTGNPALFQMLENKKIYDEKRKLYDQMSAQGLGPMFLDDPTFRSVGPEGQLNTYDAYVGASVNRRSMLEHVFNDLKANKKSQYNSMLDVLNTTGVDQGRIDEVIRGALPMIQSTKEYQQALNNEKAKAQYAGVQFDQTAFDDQWVKDLEAVGREFIYQQDDWNLNRAARSITGGGGDDLSGDPWESFGAGMISASEGDTWVFSGKSGRAPNALLGGGDDEFSFYSDNSKHDKDAIEEKASNQRLLGNVINLRDATGKFFSPGKFLDSPSNQTYNAKRTGNMYSIPVAVDFNKNSGYGGNAGEIAKAFKEKLNLEWTASNQEWYANQLPHVGRTGGVSSPFGSMGADNTWTRHYVNMEPRSLQVGNYTVRYLHPKKPNGAPVIVEMRPKNEYEIWNAEGTEVHGTVLADMSPERANYYKMQQDIGWSSYSMDGSIVNVGTTNTRLRETDHKLSKLDPNTPTGLSLFNKPATVGDWRQFIKAIQTNMINAGEMGEGAVGHLDILDRVLMPQVLDVTSMFPTRADELSKRKTN